MVSKFITKKHKTKKNRKEIFIKMVLGILFNAQNLTQKGLETLYVRPESIKCKENSKSIS